VLNNLQLRIINFTVPATSSPENEEKMVWSTTGCLLRIKEEMLEFDLKRVRYSIGRP
jgi:hypothetical protein